MDFIPKTRVTGMENGEFEADLVPFPDGLFRLHVTFYKLTKTEAEEILGHIVKLYPDNKIELEQNND